MKNLILIRHGKSEAANITNDINRKLTQEGFKTIDILGKYLLSLDIMPNIIVSSDATRAKATADIIARNLKINNIVYKELLYAGTFEEILIFFNSLKEKNILLVGHNPMLDRLLSYLLEIPMDIIHLSTGSMIHINFSHGRWKMKNYLKTKEITEFLENSF